MAIFFSTNADDNEQITKKQILSYSETGDINKYATLLHESETITRSFNETQENVQTQKLKLSESIQNVTIREFTFREITFDVQLPDLVEDGFGDENEKDRAELIKALCGKYHFILAQNSIDFNVNFRTGSFKKIVGRRG